jgi:dihydrodipicolinate synthase/N-acetylneuraminate lyase
LAYAFKALIRIPYKKGRRPFASHGLLKEALRLQGHPITNKVRRPYREINQRKSALVKKTLQNLGWLKH